MRKPASLFDRDFEWNTLVDFARDPSAGATLGIVSGRRRQGKTHLLQELCESTGGFYFAATEATSVDSLRLLAHAYAEFTGARIPPAFATWEDAIEALVDLGTSGGQPMPVVIDEFPYLCQAHRPLPSIIQKVLAPRNKLRLQSRARLVLCGSAVTFMGRLLADSAPLRGRAGLDLKIPTFDPRTAAGFWGIDDWQLAVRLYAIVGGTPAYRREYVQGDAPSSLADFDDWVCRTVLHPASPLRNEARYLLAEDRRVRDLALYNSVLGAIAEGHTTRGAIANYVGRPADTLKHPLTVLEDAGFIARDSDAFRANRSSHRIAEPLITFYHAIMRPEFSRLERPGEAQSLWTDSQERFARGVLGPSFEELARWWTMTYASARTLGRRPSAVMSGVINDGKKKSTHQVDVVATDSGDRVLGIGEAKFGVVMGEGHVHRLRNIRDLLISTGKKASEETKLLLFSGAGFAPDVVRAAKKSTDLVLVDLERIYTGS